MTNSKFEIADQGKYGIDAPNVVRNVSLIGIVLIVAGTFMLQLNGVAWLIISLLLLLGGIVCLAEAVFMVWSSKKGKVQVVNKLIRTLELKESDIVLDVGCGRGFVLLSLAKQLSKGKATGIDIWNSNDQSGNNPEVTLQNAQIEGVKDRVAIINADARALPFEKNSFDAITSCLAVHNISGSGERRKAIEEMVRVVKPNGKIAIIDFQYTDEYVQMFIRAGLEEVNISKLYFYMFPPVRMVTGIKKE